MSTKLKFEGDWAELRPKLCKLRQIWTKYLEQNREIQWNGTGQEKFDFYYACFFNAIVKV